MFIPALALIQIMPVDEPINRMYGYFKQHPSFEVNLKSTTSTGVTGSGHIIEQRPNKINFKFSYPDNTYTMLCDGYNVLEDSTRFQMYDDYLGDKELWMPDAPFVASDWRMTVPVPLFVMDMFRFFTNLRKKELEQQTTIGDAKTDVVHVQVSRAERVIDYRLYIDQEGKLLRFSTAFEEGPTVTFDLDGYAPKDFPASTFKLKTTPGYRPYELPWSGRPLHFDEKIPTDEIIETSSGTAGSLQSIVGSGVLAIVDPAWLQTANGKQAIQKLTESLKSWHGGKLTLLCEDQGKPSAKEPNLYYDASGKALDKLNAPGSPVFFLINKDSKIERAFMGFDPRDTHFWSELKQAIAEPGKREY